MGPARHSARAPAALANLLALRLEVDHHVRDRHGEALPGAGDDTALEPVRPALRVRRDDDLVGAEGAELVLDRLQRLPVADLAARLDPRFAQARQARTEPLLRRRAGLVLVGGPVLERLVQRRRHDEHLLAVAL